MRTDCCGDTLHKRLAAPLDLELRVASGSGCAYDLDLRRPAMLRAPDLPDALLNCYGCRTLRGLPKIPRERSLAYLTTANSELWHWGLLYRGTYVPVASG